MASPTVNSRAGDWMSPPAEQEGLQRYVDTIRERLRLIIAILAITTGVAVLYALAATKEYESTADMLVTPISGDDTSLNGLGLLTRSTDPTRDVETAAALITNSEVARQVREDLQLDIQVEKLLEKVEAEPVAQSNIVAVTATETSARDAADLANAFARAAVSVRTETLHDRIEETLPRVEAELEGAPDDSAVGDSLAARVAALQSLRSSPDPTIQLETSATPPLNAARPRRALSVIGGIIAGLVLGIGAAFALQSLDPRVRREAQLRRQYGLPILGRIPKESRSSEGKPLAPGSLSPVTAEAYRTLRATLPAARRQRGRAGTILITGSSPSEGKTTTAVNLAASMAMAGKSVILIEADLRRPSLGDALNVKPERGGVVGVLLENVRLEDALTETPSYGPNLKVLLADYEGGWITELFSVPKAQEMIDEARELADYVIIDSPPLNEVVDALPLARKADDVLIIVRLGRSRMDKIGQLGELLAESGIRPVGFAVVGTPRPGRGEYHYYAGASDKSSNGSSRRRLLRERS